MDTGGSTSDQTDVVLLYDDDAYVEVLETRRAPGEGPMGIAGRQVAGKEFLNAYLSYGTWSELVALVRSTQSRESLSRLFETHPAAQIGSRRLRLIAEQNFQARFFPTPPAPLLHTPEPTDPRYAWARQHGGPAAYALSGVTHTICSARIVERLCSLVTAPFEPYDALVCTSRAAAEVVRALTSTYADYLRERHGGTPGARIRRELIPLGVDTDRYRPATPEERAAERKALDIGDEVVVLFTGRLQLHSKSHPFPIFEGLRRAAAASGQKVRLILAGWSPNEPVLAAFVEGARTFAPDVRVSVVGGLKPEPTLTVWRAADIFTSLADSLQETFGLTLVEAMASGLPIVASDWNGYRDLVADGESGYLVPTTMVDGATSDMTVRLIGGELTYDHFLAGCNQAVAVDVLAAAEAYTRLLADAELRRRMGAEGRRRSLERFAWPRVIRAYEALWSEQEAERRAHQAVVGPAPRRPAGPAIYPAPERSFDTYPTRWLGEHDRLWAVAGAENKLETLLASPMANYTPVARIDDPSILRAILAATAHPWTIGRLDELLGQIGVPRPVGRATLAWMLKYDLLRLVQS